MERRLFLNILFKGVLVAPILGESFSLCLGTPKGFESPLPILVTSRDMRIPFNLRPGGYLVAADILTLELDKIRPKLTSLFDNNTFYGKI